MDRITYLIILELDTLLENGFGEHLLTVSSSIRRNRQSELFSSKFSGEIQGFIRQWAPAAIKVTHGAVQAQRGYAPARR